jgi:hypothetical protein
VGERIHLGVAVVVRTILLMRNPFGIVGAGGTTSVADGSDSPAMLLAVTLTAVRASGICTMISVAAVVPTGAPLTYSVYESASGVASHANVTARSASAEVASARIKAKILIV